MANLEKHFLAALETTSISKRLVDIMQPAWLSNLKNGDKFLEINVTVNSSSKGSHT